MTFTAKTPPSMSLKARLAYIYFFGDGRLNNGSWACVRTADGAIVVTDESCNLDTASIYPDDDSFIDWLESVADDHITDDRVEWFRQFVVVKEFVSSSCFSHSSQTITKICTHQTLKKVSTSSIVFPLFL